MRFSLVLMLAVAWCVMTVFVIRHHRLKPDSFRKTTLGGIYRDFVESMPILLDPRKQGLFVLGVIGIFCSFFPVVLLIGVRLGGGQGLFLGGGLVALVGAGVNAALILLSHMNFLSGAKCEEETVLTWLLPLAQALVALSSVVIGFSGAWVSAVSRFLVG